MEVPSIINWNSPFPFRGMFGGVFIIFIQILIEHSFSKQ